MASGLTVVVFVFKVSELEFGSCRQRRVSAEPPRRILLRDFYLATLVVCRNDGWSSCLDFISKISVLITVEIGGPGMGRPELRRSGASRRQATKI